MGGPTRAPRDRWLWALAAVAALLGLYALLIGWTGGFDLRFGTWRLRSRTWIRPASIAGLAFASLLVAGRHRIPAALRAWTRGLESPRAPQVLTIVAAMWALAASALFGTFAVGGADSYGYASQARLFAEGRLTDTIPRSPHFTWPDTHTTLTPLGFVPGQAPDIIAPLYPPGLPLLMAPLSAAGERAIYLLVPFFGLLLLGTVYRLGVRMGDPLSAGAAAALLAVSPTFLYQLVQPMSDVPAAACWLLALLAAGRTAPGAGALVALAILIRPNTAPLGAVIAAAVWFGSAPAARWRGLIVFGASAAPAVVALAWIQDVRYGSPGESGYPPLGDLFAFSHLAPNLDRYPRWLTETHTWFLWLSILAPAWIAWRARGKALSWAALALCAATFALYLPYVYFQPDEWFYSRFLMPAIPLMLFFACAVVGAGLARLPAPVRGPLITLLLAAGIAVLAGRSASHGAFSVHEQERKYVEAGAYVREQLPSSAFVLSRQHSGSVRYYAGRPTLRWDLLRPSRLDDALRGLRAAGYEPFAVLDRDEADEFREMFSGSGQASVGRMRLLAEAGSTRIYAFD